MVILTFFSVWNGSFSNVGGIRCCQQLCVSALRYIMLHVATWGEKRLKAKPNYINLTNGANLQLTGIQLREENEQRMHCCCLSKFLLMLLQKSKIYKKIYNNPMVKEDSIICIHSLHSFHFLWSTQIFKHSNNTCMCFSCIQTGIIQYHSSTPVCWTQ